MVTAAVDAAGLTTAEASLRLRQDGPNELAPAQRWPVIHALARDLANPLVLVLLLASIVSAALGQLVSAAVTSAMLVLSVALNFVQSYRSQQAASRLRERVGQTATVVRDGVVCTVAIREVVRGDLVRLAAGDLVPADARLLSAKDLFLNEAALTGESLPFEKHVVGDGRDGSVLLGTSVVSGYGDGGGRRDGPGDRVRRRRRALAARPPETEFERGTRRFGLLITAHVVLFLVLFVFLVNALLHRDALESFLFAVALAVGLTPELLPMIVTVTLARGAVRMARAEGDRQAPRPRSRTSAAWTSSAATRPAP